MAVRKTGAVPNPIFGLTSCSTIAQPSDGKGSLPFAEEVKWQATDDSPQSFRSLVTWVAREGDTHIGARGASASGSTQTQRCSTCDTAQVQAHRAFRAKCDGTAPSGHAADLELKTLATSVRHRIHSAVVIVAMLAITYALKRHYSTADAEALKCILAPTALGTLSTLVTSRIHALPAAKIAAPRHSSRCDPYLRIDVKSGTCPPGECPPPANEGIRVLRCRTAAFDGAARR